MVNNTEKKHRVFTVNLTKPNLPISLGRLAIDNSENISRNVIP